MPESTKKRPASLNPGADLEPISTPYFNTNKSYGSKCRIVQALDYIDPAKLSYEDWRNVGFALHYEGFPFFIWERWNARDPKRDRPETNEEMWESFGRYTGKKITGGTIIWMAEKNGFRPFRNTARRAVHPDFRTIPVISQPKKNVQEKEYSLPACADVELIDQFANASPQQQRLAFIQALFDKEDKIVLNAPVLRKERACPAQDQLFDYEKLIKSIEKSADSIETIKMSSPAGIWIRINPVSSLNKKGSVSNENISAYRYCLIECDHIPVEKQYEAYRKLNLPIAALTESGNKSLHALVKIEAKDQQEYDQRVAYLYENCRLFGLDIDAANKNCSRYARLAGAIRNGKIQKLRAVHIGAAGFEEWRDELELLKIEQEEQLETTNYGDLLIEKAKLPEEIISGMLRKGQIMMISADTKASKSFLMHNLALNLAMGSTFLGQFPCKKSSVFYLDGELQESEFQDRSQKIYAALYGVDPSMVDQQMQSDLNKNFHVWHLRGKKKSLNELCDVLIKSLKLRKAEVLLIDPIYTLLEGDENDNRDMREFTNTLMQIAKETGCAIVFTHHFSKGAMNNYSEAKNRYSGSGVLARSHDALISISRCSNAKLSSLVYEQLAPVAEKHNLKGLQKDLGKCEEVLDELEEIDPAAEIWIDRWRKGRVSSIDFTLRSFEEPSDTREYYLFFEYPQHELIVQEKKRKGSESGMRELKKSEDEENIIQAIVFCCGKGCPATQAKIGSVLKENNCNISSSTLSRRLEGMRQKGILECCQLNAKSKSFTLVEKQEACPLF